MDIRVRLEWDEITEDNVLKVKLEQIGGKCYMFAKVYKTGKEYVDVVKNTVRKGIYHAYLWISIDELKYRLEKIK